VRGISQESEGTREKRREEKGKRGKGTERKETEGKGRAGGDGGRGEV
jgi:hypothetical protein